MKRLILSLILIIVIFANTSLAFAAELLNLEARSYIVIDSKTGQVLYEHNADERLRPASTTKIMTAILALEMGKLDQIMTASQSAVYDIGPGGMNIGIMAGEEIPMEDLLNALLVRSANETGNIIAENICKTREEFVDLMTKRAHELGAINTNFVNPCGKDDLKIENEHLSTARDMAIMARHAMTIPKFREIVDKEFFSDMQPTNKHSEWPPLQNTNKLLWHNRDYPYTINGVEKKYIVNGVKTGYTDKAGNNLISSAYNDEGMELIGVVMCVKNSDTSKNTFNLTKKLLSYGFSNFSIQKIIAANEEVGNVQVMEAENNENAELITEEGLEAVLPINTSEWNLQVKKHLPDSLQAPISQGDVVGYIEYERNGTILGKVNIIAAKTIEKKTVKIPALNTAKNTVKNPILKNLLIGIVISVLSLVILRVILRTISRRIYARKYHK